MKVDLNLGPTEAGVEFDMKKCSGKIVVPDEVYS